MYYYRVAELTIQSCYQLRSFSAFACEPAEADVTIGETDELPPDGDDLVSGTIVHRRIPDGWFFHPDHVKDRGLYISEDYSGLRLLGQAGAEIGGMTEWHVRIALECMLARRGYVSLHSAAVEADGTAYAFTGPSGVGKSTRACSWINAFGAKLINGDRPLIDARNLVLYGVPWDGKEQCFRNVRYPLGAILETRRSDTVRVEEMGFAERRILLMQQCFMPMWDTDTAAVQMANIIRLASGARMFRVFCGPGEEDARELKQALQQHK